MSQLPYLPELLLLQKTPSSALCCFTGLARRSRRRDREPREQPSMTDTEADVQVYEPRSSLSGGLRRICSTEEPPTAQPPGGRRSLSATLPSGRRQQPQLHLWSTLDLPSLLGSVLGWRNCGRGDRNGGGDDAALVDTRRRRSIPQSTTSRQQQRRTWNFGDRSSATVTGGNHAESRLDAVNGHCSVVEIRSVDADFTDSGANATAVEVTNGHADVLGGAVDDDAEDDDNSDIVDIYLDSILDSLPDTVDATVADTNAAGADDAEIDIDIDELLQPGGGDTPIGESTARGGDEDDEVSSPSEAELARGVEASPGQAEATADGVADAAAAAAADASDGGDRRRLSDTGSELATDEFCYLRLRVLPGAGGSVRPVPSPESPPPEASPWAVDGRKRLHRRRQSYRMDSEAPVGGRALPDWSGDGGPVLLSARPPPSQPPSPPPILSLPPPPRDVVDATAEDGSHRRLRASAAARRAVVFHPAALTGRAAYLVNFLSSSGQPACRWSELLREQQRRRPRRSRFADRLCGRPQLQLEDAKAALRLCASCGHLPIVLQPSAAEEDEGGKFVGQLRAALAELPPPPLPAGLVIIVVVSSANADGDSHGWAAAAAGTSTPTLTLVDAAAPASSEPPGLDCCRAVLTAARQCAGVAAAVAPRATQTTDEQQCKYL